MSIREAKKKALQDKIIQSAKQLFLEKEFDDVTMSEIAKKADVGLGTAYNYYSSKEELFLISGGTEFLFGDGIKLTTPIEELDELIKVLTDEMKRLIAVNRVSWRSSLSSLTRAAEKKPHLFLDLVAIDQTFIKTIQDTIESLQKKEQIKMGDLDLITDLIYSTLFTNFLFYIYNEAQEFEELEVELAKKLQFLLEK